MIIHCHYCSHQSPDLKTAIKHFEARHHNGEYIIVPVDRDIVAPEKKEQSTDVSDNRTDK